MRLLLLFSFVSFSSAFSIPFPRFYTTFFKVEKYAEMADLAFLFGAKLMLAMLAAGNVFFLFIFFLADVTTPALSGVGSTVATIE